MCMYIIALVVGENIKTYTTMNSHVHKPVHGDYNSAVHQPVGPNSSLSYSLNTLMFTNIRVPQFLICVC